MLLLISAPVMGEAFKGQNLGQFLWGVLFLLLGIPAGIGLGVYAFLQMSDRGEYTASRTMTLVCAFLGWWGSMFLLSSMQASRGQDGTNQLLMVCAGVGAAVGGYYLSREQTPIP
ncbi:hypothetical protein K3G63_14085 [Hymenobacter sp. HSC-4F20]|uniref:hypothetical protein n=1 Tax=Hymenobacter sp. HSC-4F20 TaxID=2864135 RepID=UPI001C73D77A|nr:hypothetical protein [Hymenobacter sp. HSC-4F20]MBX0291575.1 hypothetical protein [Hymenobacter sp. HSC-4F20]